MIKEITMFTVCCDNCGKDANEGADYSCWSDAEQATMSAIESDWIMDEHLNMNGGDKHYCPECVSYDDEDNLVLRTIKIIK